MLDDDGAAVVLDGEEEDDEEDGGRGRRKRRESERGRRERPLSAVGSALREREGENPPPFSFFLRHIQKTTPKTNNRTTPSGASVGGTPWSSGVRRAPGKGRGEAVFFVGLFLSSFSARRPRFSTPSEASAGREELTGETTREVRQGTSGVVVVTASGEEVEADVAIVTVPLGVLRPASALGCRGGKRGWRGGAGRKPPSSSSARARRGHLLRARPAALEGRRGPRLGLWQAREGLLGVWGEVLARGARLFRGPPADGDGGGGSGLAENPERRRLGLFSPYPPLAGPHGRGAARGTAFMFWDVGSFPAGGAARAGRAVLGRRGGALSRRRRERERRRRRRRW